MASPYEIEYERRYIELGQSYHPNGLAEPDCDANARHDAFRTNGIERAKQAAETVARVIRD